MRSDKRGSEHVLADVRDALFPCDTGKYREAIRGIPVPTIAQTVRFAAFVSGAHSWYKHLPIRPKVPFVFYLDPGAGMNVIRTESGETALVEVTNESKRFHYTWQTTADYRRRFGHWNYHRTYGTTFMYAADGGIVSTAGTDLQVLSESGDWAPVPPNLVAAGTVLVNAFVHPHPNFHIWLGDLGRFGLSETIFDPDTSPTWFSRLSSLCHLIETEYDGQERLEGLIHSVPPSSLALFRQRTGSCDWPDDNLMKDVRSLGVTERQILAVIHHTEIVRQKAELETHMIERGPEPPEIKESLRRAVCAIVEERGRQLLAMSGAMGKFLGEIG